MIRIDLQPRTTRFRWLGIVIGLTIGFGAFAGALYTLDQRMPLRQLWARMIGPAPAAPAPAAPVDVARPVHVARPELPQVNDAVRMSARLPGLLAAGFVLQSLSADDSGTFAFEGNLMDGGPLVSLAASLRHHTIDVRATRWFSSGVDDDGTLCRVTGTVASSSAVAPQPVPVQQVSHLMRQVQTLASDNGLTGLYVATQRVDAAGPGYDLHRFELQGEASFVQVDRLLQSLDSLPLRVAQLDVVHTIDAGPSGHVTLSLDAFVRESPGGGI